MIVTNGKLLPLECSPGFDRKEGVFYCTFQGQKSSNRDVTRVHVLPGTLEGQPIDSRHGEFVLSYRNCNFDRIPKIYRTFEFIRRVEIFDSTVKEIESSDFSQARIAKKFTITNSKIGKIGELAFEWMEHLEEITIENCEIEEVDENAFYGTHSLKKVTLKDNYIKKGDESKFRMPNRKVKYIYS